MRRLLCIAIACAFALSCQVAFAQRGFGGGFRTGGFHGGFRGSPRRPGVSFRFGSHNHRYSDSGLYSYPFYGDAFDSDYVQSSPQVIVIREEAKTPATAPDPTPPAQPKMIEVPASASATTGVTSSSPVVIVLRDGQRRELTRYTMTGAYLYDSSKALQTSRIAIEDLDLEATVHANAERGVPFEIPTQRNEVVVRF